MRAVVVTRFGQADVLEMREVDAPEPEAGEVTIAVRFAGVGFVDTLFRSGYFDLLLPPFIPGIEVTGEVLQVGEGVTDLSPGQTVAALLNDFFRGSRAGGYADVVNASADLVIPLPPQLDMADAAGLITNGTTAALALDNVGRIQPSDTIVVLGSSGGVGGQAARLARARGVQSVIGVVGSAQRADLAAANGCTQVVVADDENTLASLHPDLVFDPVGGVLREQLISRMAPLGRYVIVGNASGGDTAVATDSLWHASTMVAGISLGGIAHLHPELVRTALASVLNLRARGELDGPAPQIVPLDAVAHAHDLLEERKAPSKIVLAL